MERAAPEKWRELACEKEVLFQDRTCTFLGDDEIGG
jgi:hypothetical protein